MKGKFLTLIGTALTLALSSTVAVAQSTKFSSQDFPEREEPTKVSQADDTIVAAAEEKLSPDAMEILCVRFPLNSRCEGKTTTSAEEETTEQSIPSQDNAFPENSIETTPEVPEPDSSLEEMQPAPGTPLPDSSPEGVTIPGTAPEGELTPSEDGVPTQIIPMPGTAPEGELTPSEDDAPSNITPMPGTTPEGEAMPSEDDAPSNITPMPGTTPEGEAMPSKDDAPSNITPMPGTTPDSDSPTNMNQPGETTLPDSDSPSNNEEETTSDDDGAKILAPQ